MSRNLIDTCLKKHVMLPVTWKTCQFKLSHEKHIRLPVIWKNMSRYLSHEKHFRFYDTCHMWIISW